MKKLGLGVDMYLNMGMEYQNQLSIKSPGLTRLSASLIQCK